MNLIYMGVFNFCTEPQLQPILGLIGYVILGIKIIVPIILVIMGMLDLAKAVTEKDENKIKAAQMLLVKRAIAAVIVFLVMTVVTIVVSLVNGKDWEGCKDCLNHPTWRKCQFNGEDNTDPDAETETENQ